MKRRMIATLIADACMVALGIYGVWPGSAFQPEAMRLWPNLAAGITFWVYLFGVEGIVLMAYGSYRSKAAGGFVAWGLTSYALMLLFSPVTLGMPAWFSSVVGGSIPAGLAYLSVGMGVRVLQGKGKKETTVIHDDPLRLKILSGIGRKTTEAVQFDAIRVETAKLPSDWETQLKVIKETEPEFLKDPLEIKREREWRWFGIDV